MSTDLGFGAKIIEPIGDWMIRLVGRISRNGQDADDALQDALLAIRKQRDRSAYDSRFPSRSSTSRSRVGSTE